MDRARQSCNSPPSARGRGAAGLLKGVFIHTRVEEQPTCSGLNAGGLCGDEAAVEG